MKRIIIIILMLAYFGASTGSIVNIHYCMGELANWGLGIDDSKVCGKCGMEEQNNGGCCKDEQKFFKASSDQKITEPTNLQIQKIATAALIPYIKFIQPTLVSSVIESSAAHDPPLYHGIAIYIFACDYRI